MSNASAELMRRDSRKRELCSTHGVVLIEVPEIGTLLQFDQALEYITKRLKEAGISPEGNWEQIELDKKRIFTPALEDKLVKLAELVAERHGGQLLSESWFGITEKYLFKCKTPGHPPFKAKASHIIHSNSWCRRCYSETIGIRCRKPFETFVEISLRFNVSLLSNSSDYLNRNSLLSFQCLTCKTIFNRKASLTLAEGALCPSRECRRLRRIKKNQLTTDR